MFGVDPKPVSAPGLEPVLQSSYRSVLEWVQELQNIEVLVNEQVNDNLSQSRAIMKSQYDKGKRDTACEAGDWVYLKNEKWIKPIFRRTLCNPIEERPKC